MKKMSAGIAIIGFACLIVLFMSGGTSSGLAEVDPHLTAEQAISAASSSAKPGDSFIVLREITASADSRRIGDLALAQAKADRIVLYENGLLVNMLRSGGYLLAEINPQTNNVVATHLVLMESGGAVKDVQSECHGVVKLADAAELVKDTAEFVNQLFSTPSTTESSLASRFDGGNFPEADQYPDSIFAIPGFLRRPGANSNEIREAAALFWGYALWVPRYALSMPAFGVSPDAAENTAEKKRDTLKAEFLQNNNMDPNINVVDFDNLQNEKQLQERIEVLKRLDSFLEDSFEKKTDPAVVRQNLSILMMPLRVDEYLDHKDQYVSTSQPRLLFLWHRQVAGGFSVKEVTWEW